MLRRDFLVQGALASLATATSLGAAGGRAPSARRLRVAQLGTAHAHASEKWLTLQRLPEVFECVGLCEPEAARREKVALDPDYAGASWMSEAELFARRDLDAVLVETELPDLLHYGRRVVAAGWHLHLDKPPGRSLAGFDALQREAAASRRVWQQGYMYRYHAAFRFCLEAKQRGWLGKIFSIHGEIGKVIGPARRPWLAEHYGGAMMLLGCHLLDLAVALMGAPGRLTAHRRNTFPERDNFLDHEVAVLEYEGGLATIRSMLAEVEGDQRRQFVVAAENATIEILPLEPARLRVAFKQPPPGFHAGYQEVPLAPVDARYADQLLDFARVVRGEPSELPQFDAAHDRAVHELLLRFSESPVNQTKL
jgi:predicted dehydrogenase